MRKLTLLSVALAALLTAALWGAPVFAEDEQPAGEATTEAPADASGDAAPSEPAGDEAPAE